MSLFFSCSSVAEAAIGTLGGISLLDQEILPFIPSQRKSISSPARKLVFSFAFYTRTFEAAGSSFICINYHASFVSGTD